MDFFTNHLGRWLNTIFFEKVIKIKANIGETNQMIVEEATSYGKVQFEILENHLKESRFLSSDKISIADLTSFTYVEQTKVVDFSLDNYPNVVRWYKEIDVMESIRRGREKVIPSTTF
jgi:glutathione S-transferase